MMKNTCLQILEDKYLLTEEVPTVPWFIAVAWWPLLKLAAVSHDSSRKERTMEFLASELYHIYNRGNNRQKIFFLDDNYIYFLKKVEKYIQSCCSILAYCLMPNHFHFFIHSDQRTTATKLIGGTEKNVLSEGIRNILSSYTQAINKRNKWTGSLFQQNTKARPIVSGGANYDLNCFHYIHQNPVRARLVEKMEDWPYSSFRDYCGLRDGTLCNKELAIRLLNLQMESFYQEAYKMIGIDVIENIL